MKQAHFTQANSSLGSVGAKPIPAYIDEQSKLVVTCWKMSLMERIKFLFSGKIWVCTIADKKNVQRSVLSTDEQKIFGKP